MGGTVPLSAVVVLTSPSDSGALVVIDFFRGRHERPEPVFVGTFDHTIELPSNVRLVASSNS